MRLNCLIILAALSACGGVDRTWDTVSRTAPGTPLPEGIAIAPCNAMDAAGRCTKYKNPSSECVNPKGVHVDPPVVPCASIQKEQ